jgi:hypothetical protein
MKMKLDCLNWPQNFPFLFFLVILTLSSYLLRNSSRADVVLVTPYKYEADVASINQAYSEDECCPWGFGHLGIDFLTSGDPKPFQAVCSGNVERIDKYDNPGNGYWQVNVSILCDEPTYWIGYAFEIWSDQELDANNQMDNILSYIQEGQSVLQGQTIGDLHSLGDGAHVHFGFRKNGVDTCPEPYLDSAARASILSILRDSTRPAFYPDARMCYGLPQPVANATITVDGVPDEWGEILPVASDYENDGQYLEGDDIKALYIATDAQHLYLRLDLWENANPEFGNEAAPHQGRYSFSLESDCWYPNLYLSVAGGYSSEGWSLGYNNSNGPETPFVLSGRPDLVGVNGGVIEVKIPFSIVGRPSKLYRFSGEVVDCCVANWTTMDETHCVSHLTIAGPYLSTLFVSSNGDCGTKEPCYSRIQDAIDDAPTGSVILVKQGTYEESISLGSAKTLLVKGGYNSAYNQQTADTTFIRGLVQTTIQASSGSLKFEMLTIKPPQ